ncbi:MAG: hypothetical protein LBR34_00855, partial [Prevotella sp.]|nr:hypothetical protein [Prevotella sp.]
MKKKSLSLFYALAAMLLSAGQLSATIRYVDGSAVSGGNNGTSWADAFVTIGDAVNAADAGDEIWIAGGTYPVDNVSIDKAVTLYGGFVSGTTSRPKTPGGTSWEFTNPTVISGSGLGATRAFTIANTVTTSTDIVFDGLTFANYAQGADRAPAIYG